MPPGETCLGWHVPEYFYIRVRRASETASPHCAHVADRWLQMMFLAQGFLVAALILLAYRTTNSILAATMVPLLVMFNHGEVRTARLVMRGMISLSNIAS